MVSGQVVFIWYDVSVLDFARADFDSIRGQVQLGEAALQQSTFAALRSDRRERCEKLFIPTAQRIPNDLPEGHLKSAATSRSVQSRNR